MSKTKEQMAKKHVDYINEYSNNPLGEYEKKTLELLFAYGADWMALPCHIEIDKVDPKYLKHFTYETKQNNSSSPFQSIDKGEDAEAADN